MKKLFLISVPIFCTALLATSCSNDKEISLNDYSVTPTAEYDYTEEELAELHKRYENINVQDYIKQYPEIFGENVLVFDTYDDAETLLTKFSECRYDELRNLSRDLGINNEIINSNIAYDSTLAKIAEENFGIDYYSDYFNELDENKLNEFYNITKEILRHEHPNWANYDDEYGWCVNPTGNIDDLAALCNKKQIVIIDKVVHRITSTLILTCPIDTYIKFPQIKNDSILWEAYQKENIDGISTDEDVCIVKVPTVPSQETEKEDLKAHIIKKGNYKLSVYTTAYPFWAYFCTHIRATITIENYYKGQKHKQYIKGSEQMSTENHFSKHNKVTYSNFYFTDKLVNGTYKSRHVKLNDYNDFYSKTKKTNVIIKKLHIEITSGTSNYDTISLLYQN